MIRYILANGWAQADGIQLADSDVAAALARGVISGAASGPDGAAVVGAVVVTGSVYALAHLWEQGERWVVAPGGDARTGSGWVRA